MTDDEQLLRRALNALLGVLEVARINGVVPTDITLTIVAQLRERLGLPPESSNHEGPTTP